MARGKTKDAAQAAPAPEITATTPEATEAPETIPAQPEPEAHLDPGQFQDMDDATLQGLAQDMGLDPAAYEDREALIAAIAAVPVNPGPPEVEAEQPDHAPAPEQPEPEAAPGPAPEPTADPEPDPVPAPEQDPGQPPEDPEQNPAGERPIPYKGTVAVSLAVLHKAVGVGTADMLKAVGTLRQGTEVTVTGRNGPFVQIKNGLWMKESFLEA